MEIVGSNPIRVASYPKHKARRIGGLFRYKPTGTYTHSVSVHHLDLNAIAGLSGAERESENIARPCNSAGARAAPGRVTEEWYLQRP